MIVESDFRAPWWARNAHLQTILPKWLRRAPACFEAERLELPDGDFIDLAWNRRPSEERMAPLVVLFHGLEGNVHSHYAKGMLAHLARQDQDAVLMHFRGCSGEPNRQLQAYHSGATEDAAFLLRTLHERHPTRPLLAIGWSLGGNMLINLLARHPDLPLRGAMVISAPLQLAACSERVGRGFSRVYQEYLLRSLRGNLLAKREALAHARDHWSREQIRAIRTLREFDEQVTAPLHGFRNADDYYHRCSGLPLLRHIAVPTLLIHAADDPFMDQSVIPQPGELSPRVRLELSRHGGHVGFLHGAPWRPRYWLEERVTRWLAERPADSHRAPLP